MIEAANVETVDPSPPEDRVVVGRQAAIGSTWMVGARLVSRVIDLGTLLVLAHILSPKDFGLVAIAMSVIFIVEAALELPLSQALVRLPALNEGHYDTAFTLGFMRGLALTAIICSIAWPFSKFYSDTRLLPLVMMLSLAPAARGLVSPKLADFARRLDFSPDFTMEFIGKLVAFSLATTVAFVFKSYWALAVGTIATPVAGAVTSYIIAPYKPRLSLKELPAFSGFLGWITAAQVVSAFNWQADRLLLGKLNSKADLGLFTAANDTSNIPMLVLFVPILRPLHSAFSRLLPEPKRLVSSYQSSATAVVTLCLPILLGESLCASPAVRLMFGEKWMGAAPLLRWLAISLIPTLFAVPMGPLVMAFGKTKIFFRRNLFEVCVKLPLVVVGAIKFHFMGVVVARCISETATVIFCMIVVRSLIKLPIREQVLGPWRAILSSVVMAGVVYLILPFFTKSMQTIPLLIGTACTALIGAVVYFSILFGLWRMVGRPSGLEAMIADKFSELFQRNRPQTAQEAP